MPAWWDSIESVAKFNLWVQWLGAILAILAGICGVLILASGSRLSDLQAKQSEAKEAEFKQRLEAAEKKQQDRKLTSEQRTRFLELLKGSPKGAVDIWCAVGNLEAYNFALEIEEMLKAAGWQPRVDNRKIFAPPIVGLKIWIRPGNSQPAHAIALLNIFDAIGFPPIAERNPELVGGQVVLVVGAKP